jgi:4'-phosphopantetheinyl transferase
MRDEMPVPIGSPSSDNAFALASGDVHIWHADLTRVTKACERVLQLLDQEERERASRFHREQDRTEFAAAHATARLLIGNYLDCSPESIRFGRAQSGKPYVIGKRDEWGLRFNASRTKGSSVFAFALEREVGVDIERIGSRASFDVLCARALAPRERFWIERLSHEEGRETAFHRFWARKEAVLKGSGIGLRIAPAEIDVMDDIVLMPSEGDRPWRVVDISCDAGYAAAVSAEGTDWRNAAVRPCEDLLSSYCA